MVEAESRVSGALKQTSDRAGDPRSASRFQPGQSANPGGRPKLPDELKARLRDLSGRAIDALEDALKSADERIRVSAAAQILDRAYGKPASSIDATVRAETIDPVQAHLQALINLVESPPTQDVDAAK
jgi:hypothetical protein